MFEILTKRIKQEISEKDVALEFKKILDDIQKEKKKPWSQQEWSHAMMGVLHKLQSQLGECEVKDGCINKKSIASSTLERIFLESPHIGVHVAAYINYISVAAYINQ